MHLANKPVSNLMDMYCVAKFFLAQHPRYEVPLNVLQMHEVIPSHTTSSELWLGHLTSCTAVQ